MGEPDQLGVERTHAQLALGARLVELAEANRHVAADDDRRSSVMPVSTSTRASGWSMTCT
jgi:hypothetical protein